MTQHIMASIPVVRAAMTLSGRMLLYISLFLFSHILGGKEGIVNRSSSAVILLTTTTAESAISVKLMNVTHLIVNDTSIFFAKNCN